VRGDLLARFVRELGDATVAPGTVAVDLPEAPGSDDRARFLVYVGLVDLLAEASMPDDGEEAVRILSSSLSAVRSIQPTFRFALFERSSLTESRELIARMRGKDIALTSEWMLPRLRRDIDAYNARIAGLRAALELGLEEGSG